MPLKYDSAKRGDSIVEVMFAFAIFSLVAIITVTMMNLGVAASERSLEMTVVRNEMNAQAEALRFVHSSYVAELTLPECTVGMAKDTKCQQYASLWGTITSNAVAPANSTGVDTYSIEMPVLDCQELYKDNSNLLVKNHAFVLNTRQLLSPNSSGYDNDDAYIPAKANSDNLFAFAPLNARIIYSSTTGENGEDLSNDNSTGTLGNDPLQQFTRVARVEGIWVVAVKSEVFAPRFYDFYIGTCWNGSGSPSATSLDTVVRLYNPGT